MRGHIHDSCMSVVSWTGFDVQSMFLAICVCRTMHVPKWFDCFVEAGMGYGSGPAISGYGFGFQGPPWAGGGMPDGTASRKRRGGDWIFSAQFYLNMICYYAYAIQFKYQCLVGIRMEHFAIDYWF